MLKQNYGVGATVGATVTGTVVLGTVVFGTVVFGTVDVLDVVVV